MANTAADEILAAIQEMPAGHMLTLHCISHSMGGLILRGALPRVFAEAPETLRAGVFLTLSTPHLGVQASWGAPQDMWRNYTWALVKALGFSAQIEQFAVKDKTASSPDGSRRPYLVSLADPSSRYVAALQRFQKRVAVTMACNDIVIPAASGSIWADRPVPQNSEGDITAGWGFDAYSIHEPQSSDLQSLREIQDAEWVESQDRQCYYIKQVLDGLLTLSWDRAIVKIKLPRSATVHVFLTGKKKDQTVLEHYLSKDCIAFLASWIAKTSEGNAPLITAPSWEHGISPIHPENTSRDACRGRWVVATEEGIDHVKFYAFDDEANAKYCFDKFSGTTRILYTPSGREDASSGANLGAFKTIRRAFSPTLEEAFSGELQWIIAAEHGIGNVKFYAYATEELAMEFFKTGFFIEARILYDLQGREVLRAGINAFAHRSISRSFQKQLSDMRQRCGRSRLATESFNGTESSSGQDTVVA